VSVTPVPIADDALRALTPTGVLRAAINMGNSVLAQCDQVTGALRGVSVELAHALGQRLGVTTELVQFAAAGQVVEAMKVDAWDVAFLAVDPVRGADIFFTPPYALIEGAYLVRSDSPFVTPGDVDRDGIRVGTGAGSAYDLYLARTLKRARLERSATAREAFDLLVQGERDVAAGVRQVIERYAGLAGSLRVIKPSFMVIEQAMAMPRSGRHEAGALCISQFVEDVKRSGFVADALLRSGQGDVAVPQVL